MKQSIVSFEILTYVQISSAISVIIMLQHDSVCERGNIYTNKTKLTVRLAKKSIVEILKTTRVVL